MLRSVSSKYRILVNVRNADLDGRISNSGVGPLARARLAELLLRKY